MKKLNLLLLLFMSMNCFYPVAAALRMLSYDDVRREGGFSSEMMHTVNYIFPSGTMLTEDEKKNIITSSTLTHLHTINLSAQDIDDSFIKELCQNTTLKRLMHITLSDNKKVTKDSVAYILESKTIGSVRDMPQISSRYGSLASYVILRAFQTGIGEEDVQTVLQDFHIEFIHPILHTQIHEPTDEGIKILELER